MVNSSRNQPVESAPQSTRQPAPTWLRLALGTILALHGLGCSTPRVDSCLVIVVDTLRADHLSLYGYPRPTSPELERWAKKGVVFENAFSTTSWTLPAFGTLFTGQLPSVHRAGMWVRSNAWAALDNSVPTLGEMVDSAQVETAAFVSNAWLRKRGSQIWRGFDTYENVPDWAPNSDLYRGADVGVDRALEWIDDQDGRFLVVLHLMDPHYPQHPPEELLARFVDPARPRARTRLDPEDKEKTRNPSPEMQSSVTDLYDAEIALVDRETARLLGELENRGLLDRMLVLFTSDHGEEIYDHGWYGHGGTLYNELLRVPLIAWYPSATTGRRSEHVSWLDLAPTLLEALGIAPPGKLPGHSLLGALRGRELEERPLIADGTNREPGAFAVIGNRYKLISRDSGFQLFDWRADPSERNDLWPGDAATVGGLLAEARRRLPRRGEVAAEELPENVLKHLRALGYLDGSDTAGAESR